MSTYDVHEGRPSWHQQKAGHTSAAVTTGFPTRDDAEAYVARVRQHHPLLPLLVVERRDPVVTMTRRTS